MSKKSKSASKSSSHVHLQVSPLPKPERVMLRLPKVEEKTGRSKTMHYDDIRRGVMMPGVAIGPRARAWPEHEVDQIIAARAAGADDDDVRQIVQRLLVERRAALPNFTPSPALSKTRSRGHRGRFDAERAARGA